MYDYLVAEIQQRNLFFAPIVQWSGREAFNLERRVQFSLGVLSSLKELLHGWLAEWAIAPGCKLGSKDAGVQIPHHPLLALQLNWQSVWLKPIRIRFETERGHGAIQADKESNPARWFQRPNTLGGTISSYDFGFDSRVVFSACIVTKLFERRGYSPVIQRQNDRLLIGLSSFEYWRGSLARSLSCFVTSQ